MKKKLIYLAAVIIVIGLIVVIAAGFNVDLKYRAHKAVFVTIGTDYNVDDVKSITNEVFGKNKVVIEKSGIYNDDILIRVADISNEQKEMLKNKLNEKYKISQEIYVQIGDEYEIEDVATIAKEVFGGEDLKAKKEEENSKYASIETGLITEEDRDNYNNKINEKYGISNEASSVGVSNVIKVVNMPRFRLTDMAKQYILYTAIATILVFVYFVVRFNKLGAKNIILESVIVMAIAELLYMAVVAITRATVNKISIIGAFSIYMVVIAYLNSRFTNRASKSK